VLTARPDGYARPDVEYTGSVTSLGSMFCDPPWEDPTPRVFLPGVGTPIAPIGGGGQTIGLVPRPG
jgi:hypothetical protein